MHIEMNETGWTIARQRIDTSIGVMPRIFFIRSAHRDLIDVSPGNEISF